MSKAPPHRDDAIDLLDADHIKVKKMFDEYKRFVKNDASDDDRKALADEICKELTIHMQLEEQVFYPQLRGLLKDDELDEAEVEHNGAKKLIAEIIGGSPDDHAFNSKVTVLGEYIDHHVKEEREGMFPEARETELDLKALRDELQAKKEELTHVYRETAAMS